jgi:hypothetical protein
MRLPTPPSNLQQLGVTLASAVLLLGPLTISWIPGAGAMPHPGGPLMVGGPSFGIQGVPFTWDSAAIPIQYRVDPGPMAKSPNGAIVISNSEGVARVNSMFNIWSSVPTASLSFNNTGPLLSSGSYAGGPVVNGTTNLANFNALMQSCNNAEQNPIIFDPNGNLAAELGLSSSIIGFEFACNLDGGSGHIRSAGLVLQGKFQDGVGNPSNFELPANLFDQAITHEIGHFIGLDHSQINVDVLSLNGSCGTAEIAGLPIMFSFVACLARTNFGFAPLAPDDAAWVSRLYPVITPAPGKIVTSTAYGSIAGTVNFSDSITQTQGVNVIARSTSNPTGIAFSAVSGYLFSGNLGQSVTCALGATFCNSNGSRFGSRDSRFVGTFEIPVAPGEYTIEVESINPNFIGGSRVGPLVVPIPMPGTGPATTTISVSAGTTAIVNITLQDTPPRFDTFESASLAVGDPISLWRRGDLLLGEGFAE